MVFRKSKNKKKNSSKRNLKKYACYRKGFEIDDKAIMFIPDRNNLSGGKCKELYEVVRGSDAFRDTKLIWVAFSATSGYALHSRGMVVNYKSRAFWEKLATSKMIVCEDYISELYVPREAQMFVQLANNNVLSKAENNGNIGEIKYFAGDQKSIDIFAKSEGANAGLKKFIYDIPEIEYDEDKVVYLDKSITIQEFDFFDRYFEGDRKNIIVSENTVVPITYGLAERLDNIKIQAAASTMEDVFGDAKYVYVNKASSTAYYPSIGRTILTRKDLMQVVEEAEAETETEEEIEIEEIVAEIGAVSADIDDGPVVSDGVFDLAVLYSEALKVKAKCSALDKLGVKILIHGHAGVCAIRNFMKHKNKIRGIKRRLNCLVFFPILGKLRALHIADYKKYQSVEQFKDKYKGKRCFILATGPSLTKEDCEALEGEITFGVNGIFRMFDRTDWRPTHYAICDKKIYVDQMAVDFNVPVDSFSKEDSFFASNLYEEVQGNINATKAHFVPCAFGLNSYKKPVSQKTLRYHRNIMEGYYDMITVVNFCVCLAVYMGFEEIYLLGADCNYCGSNQYFANTKNDKLTDYQTAKLQEDRLIEGYKFVKREIMDKQNVTIYNATRGGALEVFQRVNLDEVLAR